MTAHKPKNREIPLDRAVELFPFLRQIVQETTSKPTNVILTDWSNAAFRGITPSDLEDQTVHHGWEHWSLYSVDGDGHLAELEMKKARRIIHPARNMVASGYNDFPDDVDELGETVGDAINRVPRGSTSYVVLHGSGRDRFAPFDQAFSTLIVASSPGDCRIVTLDLISPEVVRVLAAHPELMKSLNWREFERLLARLLEKQGYEIELMRGTKDGGVDIFALRSEQSFGAHKYLLQAKRWSGTVGVEPVRELLFLRDHYRVTKACLATTSRFTSGVWELAGHYAWQLELRDFDGLKEWLRLAAKSTEP